MNLYKITVVRFFSLLSNLCQTSDKNLQIVNTVFLLTHQIESTDCLTDCIVFGNVIRVFNIKVGMISIYHNHI